MTYVVLEWNYDDVNSIIEKLSNAGRHQPSVRRTRAANTMQLWANTSRL